MAKIQSPSGTRDMYPADLLKRRYIEKLWRDTSIRHGFEEIDGPTFETADLYAVKSGEGILSEVFQVYSGKDEAEVARIRGGANAPYALRPEFTPTLARMYAAKAGSLPKPTKWFWQQNCFRAEKQQRGRLREFGQWNCDILGGENDAESRARVDADVVATVLDFAIGSGLEANALRVHLNDRLALQNILLTEGLPESSLSAVYALLDKGDKIESQEFERQAIALAIPDWLRLAFRSIEMSSGWISPGNKEGGAAAAATGFAMVKAHTEARTKLESRLFDVLPVWKALLALNYNADWFCVNPRIVRGLAYYTGTVFEVLADGERAIAGGGRYDNLIELFGGPATPAVGFGMGDVVLSLVLQDRGLMPEGDALMDALSRPSASYRPDVFVIPAGQSPEEQEAAAKAVRPLVATLRRGVESKAYLENEKRKPWDANRYEASSGGSMPLHARSSSKATKNIGKLLQDAAGQKAKLAVIVENAEEVTIKDLRTNQQDAARTKIADLGRVVAERLRV